MESDGFQASKCGNCAGRSHLSEIIIWQLLEVGGRRRGEEAAGLSVSSIHTLNYESPPTRAIISEPNAKSKSWSMWLKN